MTDAEIIKELGCCSTNNQKCRECPLYTDCMMGAPSKNISRVAIGLIKRQQAKIDELTDREARFAFDRIHYNIAELNLIKTGFDIAEIKRRFRAEFEEKMELGIDDCINWADWLDSIASELLEEAKVGGSDDR